MKKSLRFIAMFLATLMVITSFTFIALAEGEESSAVSGESSTTESSGESSIPSSGESSTPSSGESSDPSSGESSDPSSGESSDPSSGESSNPSSGESSDPGGDIPKPADKYTIKVICSEPNGLRSVSIGGTNLSAGESVSLSGEVFITVEIKEGYLIKRAVIMAADQEILELDYSPDLTAEARVSNLENGVTYTLEIVIDKVPTFAGPTNVTISTDDGNSGKLLGYDVFVNGASYGGDKASFTVNGGDKVTISLNTAEGFERKRCLLYVNGKKVNGEMNGNCYEFIASQETVDIKIYYYKAPVKFVLSGPCSIDIFTHDSSLIMTFTNTTAGRMDRTVYLEIYDRDLSETINIPCFFFKSSVVEGGAYTLDGMPSFSGGKDENHWCYSNPPKPASAQYFVVDGILTITQKVKEVDVPVKPVEHTVTVIVGEGGSVTAVRKSDGKTFTFDAKNKTAKLLTGDSLDFTFTCNEGYVIDGVFNNDESVTLAEDDKYSIVGIIKDHRIEVKFISEKELLEKGIGDADVDWDAENIVIEVTPETPVLPEVFEHIKTLKGDKYVEFRSENGSIFIPYGKESVVGKSTNMAVGFLPDPTGLSALLAEGTKYKVVSVSAGAIFPEGTLISVNLEKKSFVNENIVFYEYRGTSLLPKEALKVGSDGVTAKYKYNNETTIVFANRQFEVSITSNGGGAITPFGDFVCVDGTKLKVQISASAGYYIESITVNGELRHIEENILDHTIPIIVGKDYFIDIKFAPEESATPEDNSTANSSSDKTDGGDSDGFNPVPILIIAFVAVAGAAALFIVKWKQEKF